jgi:hypothetical protein
MELFYAVASFKPRLAELLAERNENHCARRKLFRKGGVPAALVRHASATAVQRWGPFLMNQKRALAFCLSMIFSENRLPPRIKSGAGFFGIML